MRHPIILGLTACFLATSLHAQSTISLEEFDLGEPAPTATAAPKARSASFGECLLDAAGCANSDLKAGSDFSLEDVVNLKVESNAGTAILPALDRCRRSIWKFCSTIIPTMCAPIR